MTGNAARGGRRRFLAWNILTAAVILLRRLPLLSREGGGVKRPAGREARFYRKLD